MLWVVWAVEDAPPAGVPPLGQAVRWIAQLGGFLGRKGEREPGPTALWRGLQRLTDLTLMLQVFTPGPSGLRCGQ